MRRPRRSNAVRMSATALRSPLSAAIAARWATFDTLDVACDCRLAAALITSFGPIIQPTRQPVIAYVFATPFTTTHRSARSEEHTSELQSQFHLVCSLVLENK